MEALYITSTGVYLSSQSQQGIKGNQFCPLMPVNTRMPLPAKFVGVSGVPPLPAGWAWSIMVYFCLLVSLSTLLALLLWFLLQESTDTESDDTL